MIELTAEHFSSIRPLFEQTNFGVLAAETLEGGHPGRAFVDNRDYPQAGLVCTEVGYYFLSGRCDVKCLAHLTANALIEACLERGLEPIWGCWPENQPSVSLAHNLGFQDDTEQDFFFEYYNLS